MASLEDGPVAAGSEDEVIVAMGLDLRIPVPFPALAEKNAESVACFFGLVSLADVPDAPFLTAAIGLSSSPSLSSLFLSCNSVALFALV